jgi:hypothetical protein
MDRRPGEGLVRHVPAGDRVRRHDRPDLAADRGGEHPALDELEVGEGAADDDGRRGQGIVDLRQ